MMRSLDFVNGAAIQDLDHDRRSPNLLSGYSYRNLRLYLRPAEGSHALGFPFSSSECIG